MCTAFEPKFLIDQLCYQIDINKYVGKDDGETVFDEGLYFIMDYNENRWGKVVPNAAPSTAPPPPLEE